MADSPGLLASVLTPPGRGAVAVIGFQGEYSLLDRLSPDQPPRSGFRSAIGKPLARFSPGRIVYGFWGEGGIEEEVVICRVDELTIEIQCHGGEAAIRRILIDLEQIGCQVLSWFDWLAAREGIFQAESHQALSQAVTGKTLSILQRQAELFPRAIKQLQALLEQPEFHRAEVLSIVDALLQWEKFGFHLTVPWNVVLLGRPNVGKSSLINALLGYARSIVFDQPGTTRDVVTAETAFQGWPLQFADTAGMRQNAEELEAAGMARARKRLASADVILLLLDTSQPPEDDDLQLLSEWPNAIVVAHKSDLPDVWGDQLPATAQRVSSRTGNGVQELAGSLIARLIPQVPSAEIAIPFTARQVMLLNELRELIEFGKRERARAICEELIG